MDLGMEKTGFWSRALLWQRGSVGLARALTPALNIKVSFHNTCLSVQKGSKIPSLEFAPWCKVPTQISGILCQEVEAVEGEPGQCSLCWGTLCARTLAPGWAEVPWAGHRIPGYPQGPRSQTLMARAGISPGKGQSPSRDQGRVIPCVNI